MVWLRPIQLYSPNSSSWAQCTHPALKLCTSLHGQAVLCNKQAPSRGSPGSLWAAPALGGVLSTRGPGEGGPREQLGVGIGSSRSRGTCRVWVDGSEASLEAASRGLGVMLLFPASAPHVGVCQEQTVITQGERVTPYDPVLPRE